MFLVYTSCHLPTGTITDHECECESAADLLRHINQWNVQGGGDYIYTTSTQGTAMKPQAPVRIVNTKVRDNDALKHEYMMLSRLQQDCDYVLGAAKNHDNFEKHLWADTIDEHIAEMKRLYTLLVNANGEIVWINMDAIEQYEHDMIAQKH